MTIDVDVLQALEGEDEAAGLCSMTCRVTCCFYTDPTVTVTWQQ